MMCNSQFIILLVRWKRTFWNWNFLRKYLRFGWWKRLNLHLSSVDLMSAASIEWEEREEENGRWKQNVNWDYPWIRSRHCSSYLEAIDIQNRVIIFVVQIHHRIICNIGNVSFDGTHFSLHEPSKNERNTNLIKLFCSLATQLGCLIWIRK